MNKNSQRGKLKRYLRRNIAKIFLVGLLCGSIFMAIHVVTRAMDSQEFRMRYTAYIYATYTLQAGAQDIDEEFCWKIVQNSEYSEEIKAYLGSYIKYEEFLDNLRFEVKDNKVTTYYTDDSQVRAKRIVNMVSGKICNYLSTSEDMIENITKNGKTTAEEIKVMKENTIKMGITYFTELGIIGGWFIGLLIFLMIYYGNGRIKTKTDVEDELHIAVLAEIPYVK